APVGETPVREEPAPSPAPAPEVAPAPAPVEQAPAPAPAVSYANCTEVRDAGAAPIYRGQPGYAGHLDRDGDGIACDVVG
ncbi:MAG: excalibur calcium-binding domain-containing protein, partial [Corynebacterium variabile]|uniref:excalibur calcium-binding domain-containing protein n=1 Tax=Corynebacterium variabile TaxID=1727 RepID=UPI0026494049